MKARLAGGMVIALLSKIRHCREAVSSTKSALSTTAATSRDVQVMRDILYRVRDVNHMPDDVRQSLLDFSVDGERLGKMRPKIADMLCSYKYRGESVFQKIITGTASYVTLGKVAGTSFDSRSNAVANVMEALRQDGIVQGWRNELYPVGTSFYTTPCFVIERAAAPFVGALEYGVHVNGLVQQEGVTKMWMARRSKTKSKFPGMLDHIVAGGQPAGMGLLDNVIKECLEEAGIPEEVTRSGIKATGAVSYENYNGPMKDTVSRAVLFNYDLYLPPEFEPKPVDGEVEEFFLWTIDQILESMAPDYPDPIKPNCYSVIIDYLWREGHVSPEVPGYLDVMKELRSGDCQ